MEMNANTRAVFEDSVKNQLRALNEIAITDPNLSTTQKNYILFEIGRIEQMSKLKTKIEKLNILFLGTFSDCSYD